MKENEIILENEINKAMNNELLTLNSEKTLYELTTKNVINVETMLLYNPRYSNFDYKEIYEIDNIDNIDDEKLNFIIQNKSSTYLITLIKKMKEDKNNLIFYNYSKGAEDYDKEYEKTKKDFKYNFIFHILRKINKENSTRASTSDIKKMSSFITVKCNSKIEKLIDILGNTEKGAELIGNLTVTKNCKKNFSLATKFCHYMCINYFDGIKKDNYSIYDNVVANNIPKYFEYYKEKILKGISLENYLNNLFENASIEDGLSKAFLTNDDEKKLIIDKDKIIYKDKAESYTKFYKIYQKIIDDIIDSASEIHKQRISRNGFDHILWYTNK